MNVDFINVGRKIDSRRVKGAVIADGNTVIHINDNVWRVPSSSGKYYQVVSRKNKEYCSCPDYKYRNRTCKHIFSVRREKANV